MTGRIIMQAFSQYQEARTAFVQTIANLAARPHNVESLESAGVLDLLSPLLSDVIPSIQQKAAIALGRLAEHDARIAETVVQRDIVPQLLKTIDKQNKYYKKAALFVLRAVAKHSPELATVIVQSGGLEPMIYCLEDFDYGVKEAAALGIGCVARHKESLARATVDKGAVALLVLCLQEPELCLKQISASALYDISKHNAELAQTVVDAGAVPFLVKAMSNRDTKLRGQVFAVLGSIAKHSIELAEVVVEAEIFPEVLVHVKHPDEKVNRTAAIVTREVCKHTLELAQLVVNTGGIGALIEMIDRSNSSARLPAIMALGYIAGHSDQLAIAVIGSKGIVHLATVLEEETEDHVLAISAWAIGQIGKHTPEHAKAVAAANLLPKLLEMYKNEKSSEDLRSKSKSSLKQILQKCMHIDALEPLLHDAPANILKYVLGQFSKILPNDPRSRRLFVTSGGLKKVQEIQAEPETKLAEYIQIINCCFPEEVVRYYSPGYPDSLLESVDQYEPRRPSYIGWGQEQSSEPSDSSVSLSHEEDD